MKSLVHKNNLAPKIGREVYITIAAMVLFTLLEFGLKGVDSSVIMIIGMSSINYFLVLILYVGIAILAYKGHTWLLWGCGLVVYIAGFMFTGVYFAWTMFSEWSMILFGAALVGRLTLKNEKPQKVYIIGLAAVLLFALMMYLPLLNIITEAVSKMTATMLDNAKTTLPATGYSVEETATLITGFNKTSAFIERVLPSILLLSSVLQYSIGYLVFMNILSKKDNSVSKTAPFTTWKMPFYVSFVLLIGASMRFLGTETITKIGDNILVFIAVFYSISGLSLIEYYLKKLKLPPFVKFSFYLLLFITQLIGFFGAVFAGFIDSFKDFRNKEQLNLQNE